MNTKEWITACGCCLSGTYARSSGYLGRGQKGVLRKKLRGARNYQEWKEAALTLDEYLYFNEWKKVDDDMFYDWKLVKKVPKMPRTCHPLLTNLRSDDH